VSGAPALAVVGVEQGAWRAALESAVRAEFLGSPLLAPAGSPLVAACGVEGCRRPAGRAPWGGFEIRLCATHGLRWEKAGRPPKDEWLPAQARGSPSQATRNCQVAGCPRSAAGGGLCFSHRREWRRAGAPRLSAFASTAGPAAVATALCRIAGCGFPAWPGRNRTGMCDSHTARYYSWRHHVRRHTDEPDPSLERFVARISRRDGGPAASFALPAAPLLALELRFVLQHRHDTGEGFVHPRDWGLLVQRLDALSVRSLLDHEIESWSAERTGRGRVPLWTSYGRYAWKTLLEFRMRRGLANPWQPDVWHLRALPIDAAARMAKRGTLDWRPVEPAWLRELCKRWARHRLRQGASAGHIGQVRRAVLALVEFCERAGWPLDSPACLTRELFDAFLDHVRAADQGTTVKHRDAVGVRQLFEQTHDLGWISLRNPRVYLRGELPRIRDHLPRALPPAVVKRLNEPGAFELLRQDERAAVLVLMDCGLRARDSARLRIDAVITGSDGAPYLRYWNHKRRREAVVPISDRAAEAIAVQRASVHERFPECEWLFPRLLANRRGQRPMDYAFVWSALRRWWEQLDLRDEHGQPLRPSAHMFRHTYGTTLINREVDLFAVQSLLDHDSPEMTVRYARMSKETLRRKWEQGQQRINIRGEVVPLDLDGELSDAAWAKEQIARAKQTLPNGYCGLPLQQTCPHPNACLTCPAFLTDQTFLAQHREQLTRTEQLIKLGRENGNQRLVEINEATRVSLVAIIERAEQFDRDTHEHPTGGRADEDAAA
jgi:integrase